MKKTVSIKITLESKDILYLVRKYGEIFKENTPFTKEEWPTPGQVVVGTFDYDEDFGCMISILGINKKVHYNLFFIKLEDFKSYVLKKEPDFNFEYVTTYGYDEDCIFITCEVNE